MKNAATLAVIALSLILMLMTAGCGTSGNERVSNSDTPGARPLTVRLSPANGATGVSTVAAIGITFSAAMDTLSVMSRLYFTGGSSMQMWMDSMDHSGGGGHESHHTDPNRMYTLMDSLQLRGRFDWNGSLDSCSFIPDSLLRSGTSYMLQIDAGIMTADGMTMEMDKNGGTEVMRFHFTTAP